MAASADTNSRLLMRGRSGVLLKIFGGEAQRPRAPPVAGGPGRGADGAPCGTSAPFSSFYSAFCNFSSTLPKTQ